MVRRFLITAAFAVATTVASAQKITGKVVDATTGESIIGATVKYGTASGVITDVDGAFAIDGRNCR